MLTLLSIITAKLMLFKTVLGVYDSPSINTSSLSENGCHLQEGKTLMVLCE